MSTTTQPRSEHPSLGGFASRCKRALRRVKIGGRRLSMRLKRLGGGGELAGFHAALGWIRQNTNPGQGIRICSTRTLSYPEVSGYFIPTLLQWGERDLARQYAAWLVSIQNADGSWSDPSGTAPYTFDTGQILKGLVAIHRRSGEVEPALRRGCDWMLSQIGDDGRITTPDRSQWTLPGGKMVPEAIHLYALEPLRRAGELFDEPRYAEAVDRAVAYYLRQPDLAAFNTLSHFHAYIVEALVDIGHADRAARAMDEIGALQRRDGAVPAYRGVGWVCSTGLAQYAVVWYKLARREPAEKAFRCVARLQTRRGGFYGSYGLGANYFPRKEISWAVKYYLDAMWWRIRASFEAGAGAFPDSIDGGDGRYRLVAEQVARTRAPKVLDIGCGKGRFLKRLKESYPEIEAHGMDVSDEMLRQLPDDCEAISGSLLDIPCRDGAFDLAFCVEALEHAVNVPRAIEEMGRIVRPGGTLVIIDKNRENTGQLRTPAWEQWLSAGEVSGMLERAGFSVTVCRNIAYDHCDGRDGLFLGWVARKADFTI